MDLIDRRVVRTEGSKKSYQGEWRNRITDESRGYRSTQSQIMGGSTNDTPSNKYQTSKQKKKVNKTNESRKRGSDTSAQGNEQE